MYRIVPYHKGMYAVLHSAVLHVIFDGQDRRWMGLDPTTGDA